MNPSSYSLQQTTELLANIGVALISNGANATRTVRNLERIAQAFGCRVGQFVSHSSLILTVEPLDGKPDPHGAQHYTIVRNIPHYGVNFSIISKISVLSWELTEGKITRPHFEEAIARTAHSVPYPEWVQFVLVSLATAALCKIFNGTHLEFIITFVAALLGVYGRGWLLKRHYNHYLSWFVGAFISTSVVNLCRHFGLDHHQGALNACVLWLIPGVPLINGFLDILEGHIVSGWAKLAIGGMLVFMIAVGFYLSLFLFHYAPTF